MQELVVESLMVSLAMVMLDVLVDDEAQMTLAEWDDSIETLLLDRLGAQSPTPELGWIYRRIEAETKGKQGRPQSWRRQHAHR